MIGNYFGKNSKGSLTSMVVELTVVVVQNNESPLTVNEN